MPRLFPATAVAFLSMQRPTLVALGQRLPILAIKPCRQLFSTSSQQRVHQYTRQKSSGFDHQHYQQEQQYHYYSTVTENTILSSFPRPNLNPTLHYTLFQALDTPSSSSSSSSSNAKKHKCQYCQGPHQTDNCPC